MKVNRLTKHHADTAEPNGKLYTLWDASLPGFGLQVSPAGGRKWIVRYRAEGGGRGSPQRQLALGKYPTVSAPQAREKARATLAAASLGGDPVGAQAARRREMTIAQLVDLYEQEGLVVQRGIRQGEPMKPLTAQYTVARLRHHVVPLLGKKRVSELVEADVERFARDVAKGKTARDEKVDGKRIIVRGGDGAARKVVRDLSAMLSFAQRYRIIAANPVGKASVRKTDNRRERYLSIDEVKRLGAALEELESEGVNPKALNIARLWALTGCRRNEIAGLQWEEVDFERGLLILAESKTGRSIRPLGAAAVALLKSLRVQAEAELADNERLPAHVFPASRGSGFYVGTKRIWPTVLKRAKLEGVTPHTLRHSVGSAAASRGEALLMVGALLGHSNARSTAIYAHIDRDPARLAADRATAPLAEALGMNTA